MQTNTLGSHTLLPEPTQDPGTKTTEDGHVRWISTALRTYRLQVLTEETPTPDKMCSKVLWCPMQIISWVVIKTMTVLDQVYACIPLGTNGDPFVRVWFYLLEALLEFFLLRRTPVILCHMMQLWTQPLPLWKW